MDKQYDSRPDTWEHINSVRQKLGMVATGLLNRAQVHDQSKLMSPELEVFDEVTPKLRDLTYGSDEYKASLADMKVALDHHYANNSHHPEHYADGIRGMDLLDLAEMALRCMTIRKEEYGRGFDDGKLAMMRQLERLAKDEGVQDT